MNDVDMLTALLKGHSHDSMSQDSGMHCTCGSDSRFEQRNGDLPWESIDQHRAQVLLVSDWFKEVQKDTWEEAAETISDWMWNNPTPSGIPIDPPINPYEKK